MSGDVWLMLQTHHVWNLYPPEVIRHTASNYLVREVIKVWLDYGVCGRCNHGNLCTPAPSVSTPASDLLPVVHCTHLSACRRSKLSSVSEICSSFEERDLTVDCSVWCAPLTLHQEWHTECSSRTF